MERWKTRLIIGLAIALFLLLTIQSCRLNDRDAKLARATLERQGWTPSEGKPKIADKPDNARPVLVIEGEVKYLPSKPTIVKEKETILVPCDLDALTVDLRCRAEAVELDGQLGARLFVSGTLLDDTGNKRYLPELQIGDQSLGGQVVDEEGNVTPVETAPPVVRAELPKQRWQRWRSIRIGTIIPDGGWSVGASYGRGWLGGWVQYVKRPATQLPYYNYDYPPVKVDRNEIHGGVEFRF